MRMKEDHMKNGQLKQETGLRCVDGDRKPVEGGGHPFRHFQQNHKPRFFNARTHFLSIRMQ